VKYVPLSMAGWDQRPRQERPQTWNRAAQKPYIGLARNYALATRTEIMDHVQDAFDFIGANSSICDADTTLMYAWNEHDEGGWLCPTLDGSGQDRLAALAEILT